MREEATAAAPRTVPKAGRQTVLREGALGTAVGPHQSLGMEGGPHQAQTGPRGRPSKAGRSGGGRGQRTGPRFVPSEGRGPLLLLPNTLHRANSRATGFPGRPHSAAPTFPGWWVRAPPPPPLPLGTHAGRTASGGCDGSPTRLGSPFRAAPSRAQGLRPGASTSAASGGCGARQAQGARKARGAPFPARASWRLRELGEPWTHFLGGKLRPGRRLSA